MDIKQLNVTALFSQNFAQIPSTNEILGILGLSNEAQVAGIEMPGVKALSTAQGKEVVFEGQRFRVSDKSGIAIESSTVVEDFLKVFNKFGSSESLVAFGFNYDVIQEAPEGKVVSFVDQGILKKMGSENFIDNGVRVIFEENKVVRLDYQINTAENQKKIITHLNVHFDGKTIPDDLQSRFESYHERLKNFVTSILK